MNLHKSTQDSEAMTEQEAWLEGVEHAVHVAKLTCLPQGMRTFAALARSDLLKAVSIIREQGERIKELEGKLKNLTEASTELVCDDGKKIRALEAERDKMREALEKIKPIAEEVVQCDSLINWGYEDAGKVIELGNKILGLTEGEST